MPTKIRLARHGRKRYAYYHIVVADSRAPRDGRYIERIGMYDPNTNPATIDLDFDKALEWLQKGAQPTETIRNILSYKGVLYKKHLLTGVKKGAFSEEEAENRFESWLTDKNKRIQAKIDGIASDANKESKKRLEAETKINEERAARIAEKNSELAAEIEESQADETAEETQVENSKAVVEAAAANEQTPEAEEAVSNEQTPEAEKSTPEEESSSKEETDSEEKNPEKEKKADS